MPNFSKNSAELLNQCHPDLIRVLTVVIFYIDFAILPSTIRTPEEQKQFVADGKSKTMNSKHLKKDIGGGDLRSFAADLRFYPINWNNQYSQTYLAGFIIATAEWMFATKQISHKIRWGGDWNRNNVMEDETFKDYEHFEIVE